MTGSYCQYDKNTHYVLKSAIMLILKAYLFCKLFDDSTFSLNLYGTLLEVGTILSIYSFITTNNSRQPTLYVGITLRLNQ